MMEKKYKCEKCGSESVGTPGTCCGGERNVCDTCNVEHSEHKMGSAEHNHKESATCKACSC